MKIYYKNKFIKLRDVFNFMKSNKNANSGLPNHAKKVFSGVLFDVYHWEQEQFDGTTKTFEALRRLSSVQIIATTPQKELVILKELQPQDEQIGYSLIGGGCDFEDEDPQDAARRELLEETGMQCTDLELFEITNAGGKIEWPCYYYIAHNCEIIQEQNLDSGEKIELELVSFQEFCTIVEYEHFRNQYFRNMLFRILHTPEKFEDLKKKLRFS